MHDSATFPACRAPRSLPYVIAAAGTHHNGNIHTALTLVDAAHAAGADAIRFDGLGPTFVPGPSLGAFALRQIAAYCARRDIELIVTVRAPALLDLLCGADARRAHIPPECLDDRELLRCAALSRMPLVLSVRGDGGPTGEAALDRIEEVWAVEGRPEHPTPLLLLIEAVSDASIDADVVTRNVCNRRGVVLGRVAPWHDLASALALASADARAVERALTLDRGAPGAGQAQASEPAELARLIDSLRHGSLQPVPAQPVRDASWPRDRARSAHPFIRTSARHG